MVIVSLDSPSCEVTLFDSVYRWFIGTLPDRPRDYTVWSTLEPSGVDSRTWIGIIQVSSATAAILGTLISLVPAVSVNLELWYQLWQNHLNYSGSSALVIARQATEAKRTSNGTTHWSIGSPPDSTTVTQDRWGFTSHEDESSLTTARNFYTTG
jgi:hypothetical protein